MHPRPRPSPLEKIDHPAATRAGITLYCKRDDRYTTAPGTAWQGNKTRKLAPVLAAARRADFTPVLLSFGGAYSNHVSALATAGKELNIPVHLVIRGEEVDNELLQRAARDGATLQKISRGEYRQRTAAAYLNALKTQVARTHRCDPEAVWLIPEGGTTPEAIESVAAIYSEITAQLNALPDYVCVAAGTGGTAAGIIRGAAGRSRVEVYPALKGNWMREEIEKCLAPRRFSNWSSIPGYHFGGYGKFPAAWQMESPGLAKRADIGEPLLPPLEPIYTAKLFYGVLDRIRNGAYPPGSTVVVIHTGGIY